jgi:hypothetical protein
VIAEVGYLLAREAGRGTRRCFCVRRQLAFTPVELIAADYARLADLVLT